MAEWIIEIKDGKFPIGKWEELVRCRDCKYWVCIELEGIQHTACKLSENPRAPEYLYHPSAKDFCSSGKRKDEVANG